MPTSNPKEKPVCKYCGSDDVSVDAAAHWNQETQEWELTSTFASGNCSHCGSEIKYLDWIEINDKIPMGTDKS